MFLDPFLPRVAVTVGKGSGYARLLVNLEHLLTRCKLQVHNLQTILVNLGFWPCEMLSDLVLFHILIVVWDKMPSRFVVV